MRQDGTQRVRIVEGLPGLREWMVDVLSPEFEVTASDVLPEDDALEADIFVVEVDAGGTIDDRSFDRIDEMEDARLLCCGVVRPDNLPGGAQWLPRPFEAEVLRNACRSGGASDDGGGLTFGDETHDVSPPEDFEVGDTTPDIREEALEDGGSSEADGSMVSEVVEIDDTSSMVLDVREVEGLEAGNGEWVGNVRRTSVDVEAARERAQGFHHPQAETSDARGSQSVPEVPGRKPEGSSRPSSPGSSGAAVRPEARGTDARRDESRGAGGSSVSRLVSTLAEPVRRAIRHTSSLLAESWQRLSLVARPDDRARRVRRLLVKTFAEGKEAGERELHRIPHESGMSGDLGVIGLRTLCEAIAVEGGRGRLEVDAGEHTVVLYIDGDRLDAVEDLGGRDDVLLLECLEDLGAISAPQVRELRERVNEEMSPPLRMMLRTEAVVSDDIILQARRARAFRMLRPVLDCDRGIFTFASVPASGDSSWPPEPLRLPLHDALGPREDESTSSSSLQGIDHPEVDESRVDDTTGTVQADVAGRLDEAIDDDRESTAERPAAETDEDPTEDL